MLNTYKNKLADFHSKYSRMPTYTEMLKIFNFKSKNAVFKLVQKMIEAGIVAKDHLGRLIPTESFNEIPMLGLVKAGFPSEVEELSESLNLENFLINKKENTFMLEVDGDSMIDAHIEKGDNVLVEKNNQAKDGDIVIAEVDGEFTMKYFKKQGNKIWLQPANKKLKNIYPKHSFSIVAIVKAVIRKY
jgi:SOS regulatory protein LexA